MCVSELILPIGRERVPFYTCRGWPYKCVRERVRMLLSLVAHAVGYKMMVGAHNTVVVRRMWEVLPYSPCMVDDGAHNTVDVQRHVWGP